MNGVKFRLRDVVKKPFRSGIMGGRVVAAAAMLAAGLALQARAEPPLKIALTCPAAFSPSKGESANVALKASHARWHATLTVRDAQGRLVNVLHCGPHGPGYVEKPVVWDGKDLQGRPLPAGRYTLRLEANATTPAHTWGEKKDNIPSYYYRYGRFDGKDESFYFLSEVSFNETPFALDRGVPDRVMRRFDFDGNPLGEMIYMEGSSSAMSMSFCVDYRNAVYISGYHAHFDWMPGSLCKYDGETGGLIWQTPSAVPAGVDVSPWKEITPLDRYFPQACWLRRGRSWVAAYRSTDTAYREMRLHSTTMWDTDDSVLVDGVIYMDDAIGMRPAYEFDAESGAFRRRIETDRRPELDPYAAPRQELGRETFVRRTPAGKIIGLRLHYSAETAMKWDRNGKVVWALTPHADIDKDGWRLTPPAPQRGMVGESVVWGTSHDFCPMATDIEGNSYYFTGARVSVDPARFQAGKGISAPVIFGVVKYDARGQFLHVGVLPQLHVPDIDVSADGKLLLAVDGKWMRARVFLFEHAETEVVLEPGTVGVATAKAGANEPAFYAAPKTAKDHYNRGLLCGARNRYAVAHQSFEEAARLCRDPDLSSCILCYDGKYYEKEGRYYDAIRRYEAWARAKPAESGMALHKIAECYREMKDGAGAEQAYRQAIRTGKDRFWQGKAMRELARHQAREGRRQEALALYAQLAETHPHLRPNALLDSSRLLIETQAWSRAEANLKELIQTNPLYSEKAAKLLEAVCQAEKKPLDVPVVALEATPGKKGDLVADVVLGQKDFTGGWYPWGWKIDGKPVSWGRFQETTAWPGGIFADGTYLYGITMGFTRINYYRADRLKTFMPPDMAAGGWLLAKSEDAPPRYNWSAGMMGRIGIWNLYAKEDQRKPDYFLYPSSVAVGGGKMYVADHLGCRVLVYDPSPTAAAAAATAVLGKSDFTTPTVMNYGGLGASSMSIVVGVHTDGGRLLVADTGNHRVLIWNSLPTTNGRPADVVLGQPDFRHNDRNAGGISASTLNRPSWVCTHQGRLVVADTCNHRLLIWNRIPEQNFAPADFVLGQPDFTTPGAWNMFDSGLVSPSSMAFPNQVSSDGKSLYLADSWNNRVMIWDTPPMRNNQPADRFIGQPDMRRCTIVKPEVWTVGNPPDMINVGYYPGNVPGKETAATVSFPIGVCADEKNIYVSDYERHRILVYWK